MQKKIFVAAFLFRSSLASAVWCLPAMLLWSCFGSTGPKPENSDPVQSTSVAPVQVSTDSLDLTSWETETAGATPEQLKTTLQTEQAPKAQAISLPSSQSISSRQSIPSSQSISSRQGIPSSRSIPSGQSIPTIPSITKVGSSEDKPNERKQPKAENLPKKMAPLVTSTSSSEINLQEDVNVSKKQLSGTVKNSTFDSKKSSKKRHDVLGDKDKLLGMISESTVGAADSPASVRLSKKQQAEMQLACEKSTLLQSMPPEYCSCDLGEFGEQVCQLSLQN